LRYPGFGVRLLRVLQVVGIASAIVSGCSTLPTEAKSPSQSTTPVRVGGPRAYTQVAAGFVHTCALAANGSAYCWGSNESRQLGDGTRSDRATPVAVATNARFRALSAGAYHTCGVTLADEAFCWGDNRWGQLGGGSTQYNSVGDVASLPQPVTGGLAFAAIAGGWEHTCAITTSGA